jgi:Protein of unknown function (DUF2393)
MADDPGSERRNWVPLAVAATLVLAVVVAAFTMTGHPKAVLTPVNAPADPYAARLPITNLTLSEAKNGTGGKLTYLEGHVANTGTAIVTGVTVQVIFRNAAGEVAQNETLAMAVIGMREPYVDVVPMSKSPLAPGGEHDFRLIFDSVSPDWAGALPELRVVSVQTK